MAGATGCLFERLFQRPLVHLALHGFRQGRLLDHDAITSRDLRQHFASSPAPTKSQLLQIIIEIVKKKYREILFKRKTMEKSYI